MKFGKSNVMVYAASETGKTFADVAGQDEAKEALWEVIDFLHNPQKYREIGAKMPKGILLVGPPGTGKTLLAKAVAGEAKVPFFSISGSEFMEMFVGVGAARVRDLFNQAQAKAPCIVFIDEIDTIGKSRNLSGITGNDERDQTLNQLLNEMDGFSSEKGVVILAATNKPEVLDKALLRPGRFDRRIPLELPDIAGREAILRVHAKTVKMTEDVDLKGIAKYTPGSSGADLANLINEGALHAIKEETQQDQSIRFGVCFGNHIWPDTSGKMRSSRKKTNWRLRTMKSAMRSLPQNRPIPHQSIKSASSQGHPVCSAIRCSRKRQTKY